jgi:hypothetical protein
MAYKYRMVANTGYPLELAIDKNPIPGLEKHLGFPKNLTHDIVAFIGKYVESFENLNRAYFANQELARAYHSVPYKALDMEHEIEKIIGHIHSHAYVNRQQNQLLSEDMLKQMADGLYPDIPIDVVVGSVIYIDRFPQLESAVERKAYALSMECFFSSWDLRLENGTILTLSEAEKLGLGAFVEQLMGGSFETTEDFEKSHSLLVTCADNKQRPMKVYKYLRDIMFSGAGAVISPACPSCHILTTSCDCEDAKGEQASMKTESKITQFSLDLRKVDSYMKDIRENKGGKPTVTQVKEELENKEAADVPADNRPGDPPRPTPPATMPPPSSVSPTPNDQTSKHAPCPNYMLDQDMACLFADKQCMVAGSRDDKSCYRWLKDDRGHWKFDSRNHIDDPEEVVINDGMEEVVVDETQNQAKRIDWLSKKIEQMEMSLEAFRIQRDLEMEQAATWTTQFINSLPNSSFAVCEKCSATNKNGRHLPYKDGSGKVDLPHLRNALARMNQIVAVCSGENSADLRARAKAKLSPLAKKHFPDTTVGD